MALAAAGRPNKMLTLTCAPLAEPDPVKARDLLHKTWRALRLKIARELAKPPGVRWRMTGPPQGRGRVPAITPAAERVKSAAPAALPYFAVVERHKSGRPHLHILLRAHYIPQRWLSQEMARRMASPICDIRKVDSTAKAAAYVAKYIGKAPAKFGNSRAYWYTKNWSPAVDDAQKAETTQLSFFAARPHRWSETLDEVALTAPLIDVTPDGWFSLSPWASPGAPRVVQGRYGPISERHPGAPTAPPDGAPDGTASRW